MAHVAILLTQSLDNNSHISQETCPTLTYRVNELCGLKSFQSLVSDFYTECETGGMGRTEKKGEGGMGLEDYCPTAQQFSSSVKGIFLSQLSIMNYFEREKNYK